MFIGSTDTRPTKRSKKAENSSSSAVSNADVQIVHRDASPEVSVVNPDLSYVKARHALKGDRFIFVLDAVPDSKTGKKLVCIQPPFKNVSPHPALGNSYGYPLLPGEKFLITYPTNPEFTEWKQDIGTLRFIVYSRQEMRLACEKLTHELQALAYYQANGVPIGAGAAVQQKETPQSVNAVLQNEEVAENGPPSVPPPVPPRTLVQPKPIVEEQPSTSGEGNAQIVSSSVVSASPATAASSAAPSALDQRCATPASVPKASVPVSVVPVANVVPRTAAAEPQPANVASQANVKQEPGASYGRNSVSRGSLREPVFAYAVKGPEKVALVPGYPVYIDRRKLQELEMIRDPKILVPDLLVDLLELDGAGADHVRTMFAIRGKMGITNVTSTAFLNILKQYVRMRVNHGTLEEILDSHVTWHASRCVNAFAKNVKAERF